jgi:glycosyltransferase involved in cell wall biosynthesis
VLFPRPALAEDLRRLVRVDPGSQPERHTIVPEGVDLDTVDAALADAAAHAAGDPPVPALADLRDLLDGLPPERRGLPIVVSLGRMHRVKGMATLVEAWAGSPLAGRANLLIVGGDLVAPSADEREQVERIDAAVPEARRAAAGLILAGHRPNDVAARWLAAVRSGVPGLAAPGGVYACASLKEEFGIALLEAMATGLFVVAPDGGGPATYVEDGATGILTATWDPERLADALDAALTLVQDDLDGTQVERSRDVVRERFTVQRMSGVLAGVYRAVLREEAALLAPSDGAR